MRTAWATLACCMLLPCARAEVLVDSASASAERIKIEATRQQELVVLEAQESACESRFAVTDCVNAVRTRRRQVLAGFKRQEVALNDAQRKQRALEQRAAAKERAEERSRRDAQTPAAVPSDATAEPTTTPAIPTANPPAVISHTASQPGREKAATNPALPQRQINKSEYDQKQKDVEQRRLDRDKRLKDRPGGQAAWPAPP